MPVVAAVGILRRATLALLRAGKLSDVAFIGSASSVYEWIPSRIVDFDVFMFVERLSPEVGKQVQCMAEEVKRELDKVNVDFELRIIEGPYKPQRSNWERPIVLAHVGVFDERLYLEAPVVRRWSWRKYSCELDVTRLARLCPQKPTASDLLYGRDGIVDALRDLRRGRTSMVEWKLPDLQTDRLWFDCRSHVFVEFCHSAVATAARHHARLLDKPEADHLSNTEFFPWYDENILKTPSLLTYRELKEAVS